MYLKQTGYALEKNNVCYVIYIWAWKVAQQLYLFLERCSLRKNKLYCISAQSYTLGTK